MLELDVLFGLGHGCGAVCAVGDTVLVRTISEGVWCPLDLLVLPGMGYAEAAG